MKLTLPIYYTLEYKTKKDRTLLVGMNNYKNLHYLVVGKMKRYYHQLVADELKKARPITGRFKAHYKIFYKNVISDANNVVSVIDKFVLDALQELKLIENDNVKFYTQASWEVVKQDKKHPRVEIQITKLNT